MSGWFYAVGRGRETGVFTSWPDCEKQIKSIANAKYRKFKTHEEAVAFIEECKNKYSPYKSPTTPTKSASVRHAFSLSQPSFNVREPPMTSTQPTLAVSEPDVNLSEAMNGLTRFTFPKKHPMHKSRSSAISVAAPSQQASDSAVTQLSTPQQSAVDRDNPDNLSPETLSLIADIGDQDPFSEVTENTASDNIPSMESNPGQEIPGMNRLLDKVDQHFKDIKSTLSQVLSKMKDLDTKVQMLSTQNSQRNSHVAREGADVASAGPSLKRTLLQTYNVPQPLGNRNFSHSSHEDEVEVVPVPPKKIPKIELDSDDEVDGFRHDFKVDENGYVVVYTDGACENNGKRGAKAGIGVWFDHGHPLNCSEPVKGRPTNNNAEIQAAVKALQVARQSGVKKIVVRTDSEFMINCVTKWMHKWKRNNWKVVSGASVKNREELETLDNIMKGIEVKWEHVRGHQGIHGNEMADRLARDGAERYVA